MINGKDGLIISSFIKIDSIVFKIPIKCVPSYASILTLIDYPSFAALCKRVK